MANTYCQIYIHAIFAVKYRDAMITPSFESKLHGVIGGLINQTGCKTYIVNGVENHVHCFFSLKPTVSISNLMQTVKSQSSRFVNENNLANGRFEWQDGYGAFSYNHSQRHNVWEYINNQKAHHHRTAFIDEYLGFLSDFEIPYERRYVYHDLI